MIMADDEEILVNYRHSNNHHYHDVKHSEESSRHEHAKRTYAPHDRNGYHHQKTSLYDFKERFKDVKIHLFLVNCSAPLSPNDRDLWEQVFKSLEQRLSGRYHDRNVFIHVTDESYGLHQICIDKLKKYTDNIIIHKTTWNDNKIESVRIRNEHIIRKMADYRDDDPNNVFPLIIGFKTDKNTAPMKNFYELSHHFNIKMIEKTKNDRFMYNPDFIQDNYRFHQKPLSFVDRKRPSRSDDYYQEEQEQQKVPRTLDQPEPEPEERLQSPSPLGLPKHDHIKQDITDQEIIEIVNSGNAPEDIIQLKEERKIPSAFVDEEFYPNGDLWKITTVLIFSNKLYPDYDGEQQEEQA